MFYLHHSAPKDGGAEARRFPYVTIEEALAQAAHDLSRKGQAPLVEAIRDEDGELVMSRKEILEEVG